MIYKKKFKFYLKSPIFILSICGIFFILNFIICYIFKENLLNIMLRPLPEIENIQMIYTNLTGGFTSYLKIVITFSLLFTMPMISFQIFLFISPALKKFEKISR